MIYNNIYALVEQYIYGSVAVGSYQELVCIAVATMACLFIIALPFLVVWRVIRMVVG